MNRQNFIATACSSMIIGSVTYYLICDKNNFVRAESKQNDPISISLNPDEKEILFLASLAPSCYNSQPWFVKYVDPYHWIFGNTQTLNHSIGINEPVQFILHTAYVNKYSNPATLSRSVAWFLRN